MQKVALEGALGSAGCVGRRSLLAVFYPRLELRPKTLSLLTIIEADHSALGEIYMKHFN